MRWGRALATAYVVGVVGLTVCACLGLDVDGVNLVGVLVLITLPALALVALVALVVLVVYAPLVYLLAYGTGPATVLPALTMGATACLNVAIAREALRAAQILRADARGPSRTRSGS